jgi:hypothetical protein
MSRDTVGTAQMSEQCPRLSVPEQMENRGGTAIDHLSSLSLDLRNVLGADVTVGIDPQGGDAGGAKVVFREEFVARWLAHAQGNEKLICERSVKMLLETPPRSAHGNCGGGARAGRRLEANANAQIQR